MNFANIALKNVKLTLAKYDNFVIIFKVRLLFTFIYNKPYLNISKFNKSNTSLIYV